MTTSSLKKEPLALATVIQVQAPTSASLGDKALVSASTVIDGWVGGGCVQPAVVKAARSVLVTGESCLMRVAPDGKYTAVNGVDDYSSHCLGKGCILLYVEPINAQPMLSILGESAVAGQLAVLAAQMDFSVTLCGNNEFNSPFPIQLNQINDFVAQGADYVVIATQGQSDIAAINAALSSECQHIEIIISKKKLTALKTQLLEDGYSKEQLSRLKGPAGININAKTTNEVALSVLASIIETRRSEPSRPVVKQALTTTDELPPVQTSSGGCCGAG